MSTKNRELRKDQIGDSVSSFSALAVALLVFAAVILLVVMGYMALTGNGAAVAELANILKHVGIGLAVTIIPLVVTGMGWAAE